VIKSLLDFCCSPAGCDRRRTVAAEVELLIFAAIVIAVVIGLPIFNEWRKRKGK
jgi:hypothetical protein